MNQQEIEKHRLQIKKLGSTGRYAEAYSLAKSLHHKYPDILIFAYYEAVMTAEDDFSFTSKQVNARFKLAAKKLKLLLLKSRKAEPNVKHALRNEYYWFSKQSHKQYLLGLKAVKNRLFRSGYYSEGVGASQVAKNYALLGNKKSAIRWAKKSEYAWLKFFELDPNWYNSYFFYAMALGLQNRLQESEQALTKAARLAKKPKTWKALDKERKLILEAHQAIY